MWYTYTFLAVVVWYVDYLFDMINGIFLNWPQDFIHLILFILTVPIRFMGILCMRSFDPSYCVEWKKVFINDECEGETSHGGEGEGAQKKKTSLRTLLIKMAQYGPIFEDAKLIKLSRAHLLCVDLQIKRNDSIKCYANFLTIAAVGYFYYTSCHLYHSEEFTNSWLYNSIWYIEDTLGYEIDMSDLTFVCLYLIFRTILRIIYRVYILVEISSAEAGGDLKQIAKFLASYILLFRYRLRSRILPKTDPEYWEKQYELRLINFELFFVKLLCPENTYLKFRRRNRNWEDLTESHMSLHKDIICGLLACAVTICVNFYEEHQFIQKWLSEKECSDFGSSCKSIIDQHCWCTIDYVSHIPTFIAVVSAGILGVMAVMRAVVSFIFAIWLLPKWRSECRAITVQSHCISDCESDFENELSLPQTADITFAIYGFPIDCNWRKRIAALGTKGYPTENDLRSILKPGSLEVTNEIKNYLYQGTTQFWLEELKGSSAQPVLIVIGGWYGAKSTDSEIRNIKWDAVQSICISLDASSETPDWINRPPPMRMTSRSRSILVDIPRQNTSRC